MASSIRYKTYISHITLPAPLQKYVEEIYTYFINALETQINEDNFREKHTPLIINGYEKDMYLDIQTQIFGRKKSNNFTDLGKNIISFMTC